LLTGLGVLPQALVARTLQDYEDLAVAFARSWARGRGVYEGVRERLESARQRAGEGLPGGGFFDTSAWANGFEAGMHMAAESRVAGSGRWHVVVRAAK
jgi:hypothetical protein